MRIASAAFIDSISPSAKAAISFSFVVPFSNKGSRAGIACSSPIRPAASAARMRTCSFGTLQKIFKRLVIPPRILGLEIWICVAIGTWANDGNHANKPSAIKKMCFIMFVKGKICMILAKGWTNV
jgi:hypothetical protein